VPLKALSKTLVMALFLGSTLRTLSAHAEYQTAVAPVWKQRVIQVARRQHHAPHQSFCEHGLYVSAFQVNHEMTGGELEIFAHPRIQVYDVHVLTVWSRRLLSL
jgi:hypothetical protein